MKTSLKNIYYSFPIRLFLLHLRSNLLFLGLWLFLLALITGQLARKYGAQYLFLDPEYLGSVNFLSFFILGVAFGGFYMTWNLTTYLVSAHHFPFLATLSRPFTKFCINNLLLPFFFFAVYLGFIIYFQSFFERGGPATFLLCCLGFISGTLVLILLYFLYFQITNRDISHYKPMTSGLSKSLAPGRHDVDLEQIKEDAGRWRVDTYLTESLQPRLVRSVAHYDASLLMSIFKHHHLNALILQLVAMVILVSLGSLIDYPMFRIPAAASIFIMASIFTALIGALSYWFAEWKVTILILFVIGINFLTSFDWFRHKNPAFGLNYQAEPADYNYKQLLNFCAPDSVAADKANTVGILNRWRQRVAPSNGNKPKLVILSVSGGGLKAANWAMRVVQEADSLTNGKLLQHTVLITGASGGMLGMAYLRELYLRRQLGDSLNLYDSCYLDDISKDLLNSVAFTLVSNDIFLPWARFEAGGYFYRKDRGYIFERQLSENTNQLMRKTVADYAEAERNAIVPMLYITPSIVNDARRLIISPQGVSFMMIAPPGVQQRNALEIDAVDFGKLFARQDAANLEFLSALRMNATYPYILPSVFLPSSPGIEVMDAGFRDNFGLLSATRFLHVFKEWILRNTSGVVLVQVNSSEKIEEITPSDNKGIIGSLLNPFGIPGQLMSLQEFEQDNSLGFIYDLLGEENFHFIRFTFRPEKANKLRATISFHITEREKKAVYSAINEEDNQTGLQQLQKLLAR